MFFAEKIEHPNPSPDCLIWPKSRKRAAFCCRWGKHHEHKKKDHRPSGKPASKQAGDAHEPLDQVNNQTNAALVDFLLIDSETAITFMNRAEDDSCREEDRIRRFEAASKGYNTIVKLLPRTTLTQEQYEALMKRLAVLRERLDRHLATYRKVA